MKRIAIFASGSGTNAENIIRHFKANGKAIVEVVLCNNPKALVIERAKALHTPSMVFTKEDFYESPKIENLLVRLKIDLIVLAGFLWLVPESLIKKFPGKFINDLSDWPAIFFIRDLKSKIPGTGDFERKGMANG